VGDFQFSVFRGNLNSAFKVFMLKSVVADEGVAGDAGQRTSFLCHFNNGADKTALGFPSAYLHSLV